MKRASVLYLIFFVLISTAFLQSCMAPAFKIKPTGDKFTSPGAPIGMIGENNRLSTKSSLGGVHMDGKGVYIDPVVYKDKSSNKIVSVGFSIIHYSFEPRDGFNPIERIVFLTASGQRIEINVKYLDSDYHVGSWNNISKEYNTTFNESGKATISLEDYTALAKSKWIEAKIIGGKMSQIYNKDEILPSFVQNLNTFYESAIR